MLFKAMEEKKIGLEAFDFVFFFLLDDFVKKKNEQVFGGGKLKAGFFFDIFFCCIQNFVSNSKKFRLHY